MARSQAPSGPPPAHFRPPDHPLERAPALDPPLVGTSDPPPRSASGASARVVAAIAVGMLLFGLVFGVLIGRAFDDAPSQNAAAPTTTTPSSGGTIPPTPPTSAADPNAPPSTDLEPTIIGTIDDPIPIGEPYILGLYEVTVIGADFDAADRLIDHDANNPEPAADDRRVLVEIMVRYVDPSGVADTSYLAFNVSDGVTEWTDLDAACGNVPDSILDGFFLGPGDEATGNTCLTVPATATESDDPLYLTTEGFDGPVYFALE